MKNCLLSVDLFFFSIPSAVDVTPDKTCFPLIDTRLTFITRENRLSVDKIPIRRDSAREERGRKEEAGAGEGKKIVSCAVAR